MTPRLGTPSRRWYLRWLQAYRAAGGWCGPATIDAIWPRAVDLYRLRGTAAAVGVALAEHYRLHSQRNFAREEAEGLKWELDRERATKGQP